SLWISRSIPALVMRIHDLLGHRQNRIVAHADTLLGLENDVSPVGGMFSHLRELLDRERTRFIKDTIGHADFADIVKRSEARQQLDSLRRQIRVELRMRRELLGEQPRVLLRSTRMTAGLGVPDFRK